MDRVRLTDVSPRDGLQNEPRAVPTETKAELVRRVSAVGVPEVEITSFVGRSWIPQLGDAEDLVAMLASDRPEGVIWSALVPNEKGLARLLDANRAARESSGRDAIGKASVFTAASETFSRRNTNASIDETIERFVPVIERARDAGLDTRGYVSCAVACPFEGPINAERVVSVSTRLREIGIEEIDLGDTIGAATPETIGTLIEAVRREFGDLGAVTLHLHDTFGQAGACAIEAMRLGVRSFDATVSGLGGCPYASTEESRAPGNISASTLLDAVRASGLEPDPAVDADALEAAVALADRIKADGWADAQAETGPDAGADAGAKA